MDKKVKNVLATVLAAISILALFTTLQQLPSAKAVITPEFFDPLGNETSYSFEGPRNTSMFTPPPGWTGTGQRFLETDPNSDGKCDIKDLARVSAAFGSYGPDFLYPGSLPHPRWNLLCDFNKDGKVELTDLAPTSANFGKPNQALDGKRSWLMGSSGVRYLSRQVANSCIPFLQSETYPRVTFAFYFLPEKLYADDGAVLAEVIFTCSNGSRYVCPGVWTVPMSKDWTVAYAIGRVYRDELSMLR